MLRPPFVGHRRYSITHRAVQRLRELVPGRDELDDEALRDRLDEALATAEDGGRAVQTLDAMLGEPQTLIPVESFGDLLYAIIKEDTVVTVLPKGHGEEILHRGQVMEQRVAAGQANVRGPERQRPELPRRRWQKEPPGGPAPADVTASSPPPVVVQRIGRPRATTQGLGDLASSTDAAAQALVVPMPPGGKARGPIEAALHQALEQGRRRAAVLAIRDVVAQHDPGTQLLPLWNALAHHRLVQSLTLGDLVAAVQTAKTSHETA